MADEKYLSIEEVAKRLGVEEKTIGKYVREGKLKAVKNPINGSIVGFRETDIQEFLTGKPAEQKVETKQAGDISPEVAEAKTHTTLEEELTKQAKLQNEQHHAKIQMEMEQKGYDSIEAGLVDVEAKMKEALDQLEMANRERASVRAELEAVAREKQKVVNALAVVKLREEMVDKKRAEIMVIEEKQKEFIKKYADWRQELLELADYHKANILPCVKAMKAITKTIYSWVDILSDSTGHDWVSLYNWLGRQTKVLDTYVDHADKAMAKEVLHEDGDEQQKEEM